MAGGMHGRGACVAGGHVWQILRDTVNERAVRILLVFYCAHPGLCPVPGPVQYV